MGAAENPFAVQLQRLKNLEHRNFGAIGRPLNLHPFQYGMTFVGSFTMPGKIKTKSNEKRWNRSRSPEIIAWEKTVAILAAATLPKAVRKEGWVIIHPYFMDKVHPDLNNCTKSLFDGLKAGGIFTDDKYVASTVLPATYGQGEKTEVFVWAK